MTERFAWVSAAVRVLDDWFGSVAHEEALPCFVSLDRVLHAPAEWASTTKPLFASLSRRLFRGRMMCVCAYTCI